MNGFADLSQWALLFGVIMPLVVGIVTKKVAHPGVKALTLFVLNAVNGVLTDFFATPNGFDWKGAAINALAGLLTSIGLYYGLYEHTIAPKIADATARFGIGAPANYDANALHRHAA